MSGKESHVRTNRPGFYSFSSILIKDNQRGEDRLWNKMFVEKHITELLKFEIEVDNTTKLKRDNIFVTYADLMSQIEKDGVIVTAHGNEHLAIYLMVNYLKS